MNRIFVGFMICFLFLNCDKKEKSTFTKNKPYIISKEKNRQIKNGDTTPPPPIPGFLVYGTNTFIIDSDSKIYYFKRGDVGHICGNWAKEDTIPYYINLHPRDLIEVQKDSISEFVKSNYTDNFRNLTFVSSKLDTLKSESFYELITALELSLKDRDFYYMRRTTQEEDTVLKYKKTNTYYNSEQIKWDENRITFPLIKPKLEKKN